MSVFGPERRPPMEVLLTDAQERMIRGIIDDSIVACVSTAGGFVGAMLGLHIGARVFTKMLPEKDDITINPETEKLTT